MAARGMTIEEIMLFGRWKSQSVARGYVEASPSTKRHLASVIAFPEKKAAPAEIQSDMALALSKSEEGIDCDNMEVEESALDIMYDDHNDNWQQEEEDVLIRMDHDLACSTDHCQNSRPVITGNINTGLVKYRTGGNINMAAGNNAKKRRALEMLSPPIAGGIRENMAKFSRIMGQGGRNSFVDCTFVFNGM